MIKGLCYCTANEDLNESNDIGYEKGKEVKDFIKITDLIQGQEKSGEKKFFRQNKHACKGPEAGWCVCI